MTPFSSIFALRCFSLFSFGSLRPRALLRMPGDALRTRLGAARESTSGPDAKWLQAEKAVDSVCPSACLSGVWPHLV